MTTKRILFLTFYFPPDLSAGSFRAGPLLDALIANATVDVEIDVVSTAPHRYSGFAAKAAAEEHIGRHTIRRIQLPEHKSGVLDQARAFCHYWFRVVDVTRGRHYDLVVATSSRLLTAVLGAWIARRKNALLYLDLRDIFVETITEVLPRAFATLLSPFLVGLERWTIGRAVHVNLVSRGFASYFELRYPDQSFSYLTNGIDAEFISRVPPGAVSEHTSHRSVRVLYAGNMGEGQGLHAIVPELAYRLRTRASFRLIGSGGKRARLSEALALRGCTNVQLIEPMRRDQLIQEYIAADVLFLHLNDYEAFKRVLPSKVFEYAALGKPIWAGVAGYAAAFIQLEVENAVVFPPCDVDEAVRAFEALELRWTPREAFVRKYSRCGIMNALAVDMLSTLNARRLT